MKKICYFILSFSILFSIFSIHCSADSNYDNFKIINEYSPNQFSDVKENVWYEDSLKFSYELGLVKGSSETSFNPTGNITIAETITLACRIHSIYNNNNADFTQGNPWYQVYVDYAINNGIITSTMYSNYDAKATRAQFAQILSKSLPTSAFTEINYVEDEIIWDIPANSNYYNDVYMLYRSGILTGNDKYGTFTPNANIQRSAVAAIVARIAVPDQRKSFTPINYGVSANKTCDLAKEIAPYTAIAAKKYPRWQAGMYGINYDPATRTFWYYSTSELYGENYINEKLSKLMEKYFWNSEDFYCVDGYNRTYETIGSYVWEVYFDNCLCYGGEGDYTMLVRKVTITPTLKKYSESGNPPLGQIIAVPEGNPNTVTFYCVEGDTETWEKAYRETAEVLGGIEKYVKLNSISPFATYKEGKIVCYSYSLCQID